MFAVSRYTFEVAPVFTLMEQSVLNKMSKLVGFQNGDGIFCPGRGYTCNINILTRQMTSHIYF